MEPPESPETGLPGFPFGDMECRRRTGTWKMSSHFLSKNEAVFPFFQSLGMVYILKISFHRFCLSLVRRIPTCFIFSASVKEFPFPSCPLKMCIVLCV